MEALQENLSELDIGNTVESVQKFLDSQRDLFHGQIDQLQNIVVTQCKLTGANPLSQEMAAGALSIKIGKRPRDLLNPKAVKYMQSVFSVKDAITKRESREISALFGVTVTQVREFFASQRSRVRRLVRVSREKSIKSNACQELLDGISTSTASVTPNDPVPLNTVGPTSVEEAPSCSTQDEALLGIDDSEKHFVENIFNLMRKEENFSGQVKLMEWILQIQNSSVLNWFLTKGGVMILATWLSQAAIEEQTSVLFVILKVLCHLPLHKALPVHMSAILQSVNSLRFYKTSDISNRARVLLSRWSKIFARSQAMKKPNAMKSSSDIQKEMMLKQSISEIMGDESWQSKMDISEQILAPSYENSENFRNLEPPKAVKLLQASADDLSRKHGRGVSSPQTRERRKVLLVEQPGQKTAGRNQQVARVVSASQGRPMSADDIQKAKMRAHFMQSKHGKIGSSNGSNGEKTEGTSKAMTNQASVSHLASKVHLRPPIEEHVKPVALPSKTSNQLVALVNPKPILEPKEPLWEKCKRVQIPWQIPPEVIMNSQWGVGIGEDSKEVEVQKNRLRREKETVYQSVQEIPPNPKNPWDVEMDYDDSLTPEIPIEQPPDAASAAAVVTDNNAGTTEFSPGQEYENRAMVTSAATTSQIGSASASQAEPDLELLAVLLKNPELVFALTSGQGGNLSSEDTVRLLDMIKSGGNGLMGNLTQERVEVSLPSPTPSSNPGTSGWRPEVVNNPFSKQNSTANMDTSSYTSRGVASNLAATATQHPQQTPLSQHGFHHASMHQQTRPEKRPLSIIPPVYQNNPINPILHSPTPPTRDYPVVANHNMHNHSIENSSNVNPSTVSISSHTLDRTTQASFSLPPLLQTASLHEPPSIMRPNRQIGNSGPTPDSWSGRQGLAQNPYLANPDNYSSGPVRPGQGGHWERDEYVGEDEFEHWSPESRRYYNNNNRYVENSWGGWNYLESRANFGLNDRPDDRSRPRNSSSGYQDHGRHGNRRLPDRGGRDHDDHRRR